MVSCKQCNSLNSLDSTFCKKCGATLDANDIAAANDKLVAMIADGNRLFADGRTDDALMVAETAISSNPSSASAVSLKGMCLERKGLIAEALLCFEQVVVLQPDSTLDKLKVNDLKNLLVVEKFEVNRRPDRKVALMGAIAATVLVVSGGAIFAKAGAKSGPDDTKLVAMNEATGSVRTFDEVLPKEGLGNPNQPTTQQQTPANVQQPNQENQLDGNGPTNTGRDREPINIRPYRGETIPRPSEGVGEGSIGPVKVEFPGGQLPSTNNSGNSNQTAPNNNSGAGVKDPEPLDMNQTPPKTGDDPKPPKNDPGIIEIEVSKGAPKGNGNSGGGDTQINGNGRQALMATARSQMQSGNYSAAASTFERALRAGADQGSTNQRLGQCYAQMGRSSDAVAAYTRAASAFEKSGNSQGADACRQAIKVLGG